MSSNPFFVVPSVGRGYPKHDEPLVHHTPINSRTSLLRSPFSTYSFPRFGLTGSTQVLQYLSGRRLLFSRQQTLIFYTDFPFTLAESPPGIQGSIPNPETRHQISFTNVQNLYFHCTKFPQNLLIGLTVDLFLHYLDLQSFPRDPVRPFTTLPTKCWNSFESSSSQVPPDTSPCPGFSIRSGSPYKCVSLPPVPSIFLSYQCFSPFPVPTSQSSIVVLPDSSLYVATESGTSDDSVLWYGTTEYFLFQ